MIISALSETIAAVIHDIAVRDRLVDRLVGLGDPCRDVRASLALAEELRGYFSVEVRSAFRGLRDNPYSPPGVVVRGAGRDPSLPPTPAEGQLLLQRPSYIGEWVLLVLASSLGTVISYREQRSGQLFNHIVPVKGFEDEISSQGSRTALGLHRECTFSDVGPDFLGLYCHRGGGAATCVVSAARVSQYLTDQQWDVLSEPRFTTPLPPAFRRAAASPEGLIPHCILAGERDNPEIRVDTTLTRGSDAEAQAVLEELHKMVASEDLLERIVLEPGDVLFLDNRRCLHGREAFTARFDGCDRWLVRIYAKCDVWACRERLVSDHILTAGQR